MAQTKTEVRAPVRARPPLTSTAKQKKALTLKQQVALFYARKRRKARANS